MHELEPMIDREPPEVLLERALVWIAAAADAGDLEALSVWAQTWAEAHPSSMRAGVLMMIAGAAAARARALTRQPAGDAATIAELDALQRRIDASGRASELLAEFAVLAASLLSTEVPRYFDMQVDTTGDDTVFYWTSGVIALKALLNPEHCDHVRLAAAPAPAADGRKSSAASTPGATDDDER